MLYRLGPILLDTFPAEVGSVDIETTGEFAKHPLLSRRKSYEPSGPGDDTLDLSGQLLPFHIGGLSELEYAKQIATTLEPVFVMRGDGYPLGWYQLLTVRENHSFIAPGGVGYVVKYSLKLEKIDDPSTDVGGDLIETLVSLFG